jgi:DDE superfamily endonuclease
VGITPVYVGRSHDFTIFKEEKIAELLPAKTPIYTDTGFEGIQGLNKNLNVCKPKKKKIGRKLNGGEQLGNRLISKERVKVEHAICGIKSFRIIASVFRGISHSMDTTFKLVCGLWNYLVLKRSQTLVR